MKNTIIILLIIIGVSTTYSQTKIKKMSKKVQKTEEEWKAQLTEQEFYVLRQKGTDAPSEDGYTATFDKGTYQCRACGTQLFESNSKFQSHCGWPSFDDAIEGTVIYKKDTSFGRIRTEIICATCDGHLGHIFDDGPKETTGKRYCVNTSSIKFIKSTDK